MVKRQVMACSHCSTLIYSEVMCNVRVQGQLTCYNCLRKMCLYKKHALGRELMGGRRLLRECRFEKTRMRIMQTNGHYTLL